MADDDDDILERIARIVEAAEKRRRPNNTEYSLIWTPMVPYSENHVAAIESDAVGSCVYEIWRRKERTRTALYVGETQSLGVRLRQHAAEGEANEALKAADRSTLYFSYAEIVGPVARKSVERALWKLYHYPWNDKDGPKGMGVDGLIVLIEQFPAAYSINFNGTRRAMEGVKSPVELP